jgi:acyl-CoA thioesterase FadM
MVGRRTHPPGPGEADADASGSRILDPMDAGSIGSEVPEAGSGPASLLVQRVVEWHDIDAAGISHNSLAVRLMESAETALLERLGLGADLVNPNRRRRIVVDYLGPLVFHDRVDVRIRTAAADEDEVTFEVEVLRGDRAVIRGTLVAAPGGGRGDGAPTAEEVVRLLNTSGAQVPELLG